MNDGGFTPVCACGKGNMRLCCAGETTNNPGRYYYKCLVNGDHPRSFKWYYEQNIVQEHRKPKAPQSTLRHSHYQYRLRGGTDTQARCNQCFSRSTSSHTVPTTVKFGFMCMVLVLLGCAIGKIV